MSARRITYQQPPSTGTSVLYVLEYFIGLVVFGIAYLLLNGILADVATVAVEGIVYDYGNMFWTGGIAIYLIIGVFWLPGKIRELKRGGM